MTWAWHNPVPVAHDPPPHPAVSLFARLESVFLPLLLRIAEFASRLPSQPHLALLTPAPILLARILLARTRLARAHARIAALLHRLAEGTWQPPRPHAPRPSRKRAPTPYLPRRKGWLGHVTDHHVRAHASQLTHLLNDPGTQAILSRAPAQARATLARLLRGPTRLLALDLPNQLQFAGPPRPPRIRKPRPRPERPQGVLPTDRPIPRNVLAFARYNRRRFGKGA
jgi:hypothetical protein